MRHRTTLKNAMLSVLGFICKLHTMTSLRSPLTLLLRNPITFEIHENQTHHIASGRALPCPLLMRG